MSGSSKDSSDAFQGLEWRNVLALVDVLRTSKYTKTEHIKRKYLGRALQFNNTLAFASSIGALIIADGQIRTIQLLQTAENLKIQSWFIEKLFNHRNRYRTRIFRYLRRFHLLDGQPIFAPPSELRYRDSHVRNFLMEIRVVSYDSNHNHYHISPEYIDQYAFAYDNAKKQSPEGLISANQSKAALGLAAEKEILAFEHNRLGVGFTDQVQHVAVRDVAAGYDIRSVTLINGAIFPRYIEVKAVSKSTFEFYWTHNEVQKAKHLAEWYYLYLLPVKGDGQFSINDLQIIANPNLSVLQDSTKWCVEQDVLRCFSKA